MTLTIPYEILFEDLFRCELKPVRNNDVAMYRRSGKPASIDAFLRQVGSVDKAVPSDMMNAALDVATEMKGLQRVSNERKRALAKAVALTFNKRASCRSAAQFAAAIEDIATRTATKSADSTGLRSAASKMLQVLPSYRSHAVIYDAVVQRALGPAEPHLYVSEFETQFVSAPIIRLNRRKVTFRDFLECESVQLELRNAKVPRRLTTFVARRAFDRALWLAQRGKDLAGSRVGGLEP